jgi:hypothetical protein
MLADSIQSHFPRAEVHPAQLGSEIGQFPVGESPLIGLQTPPNKLPLMPDYGIIDLVRGVAIKAFPYFLELGCFRFFAAQLGHLDIENQYRSNSMALVHFSHNHPIVNDLQTVYYDRN